MSDKINAISAHFCGKIQLSSVRWQPKAVLEKRTEERIEQNTMACLCVATKTDMQIIRKMARIRDISPVDAKKFTVGKKRSIMVLHSQSNDHV